ncbi:MAG TPA: hypothetical protein DEP99_05570 [Nitrospiraceae bacterium]|nr:hypothetical protein [Nitrospiraceae bacterium]
MIKLLIFDLDGTLVDSIQDITDALNYALAPLNIGPFSTAEIKEKVGSGITKLIEGFIPEEKSGMRDEITKRFLEQYSAHLLDNTNAYPGVKETLLKLGDYRKAVVSNKREALSKAVLDGLGLANFFDVILGSDSVPEKKPSPAPIIKVLETLGIDKDEAMIVGDSNLDIEAGKKAGIKTLAVTYGYRGKEFLTDADYMIDNMRYLLTVLQKLNSKEISYEKWVECTTEMKRIYGE